MLGTILFVYCLLFINTFYLSKLDSLPYLFGAYDKSIMKSGFTLSKGVVGNNNNLVSTLGLFFQPISAAAKDEEGPKEGHNSTPIEQDQQGLQEQTNKLNPWFVTGFTDAEGCFLINVRPNSKMKSGYSVELVFKIALHSRDSVLVKDLLKFFGVGTVTNRGPDCIQYWAGSIKDLQIIINHFDAYPLISQKRSDYELFKQVFELILHKEPLTTEGVKKIISIKAVFNHGLADNLKVAFPDIVPAIRPSVSVSRKIIPDPQWLSGFVSGEGCFMVNLIKSSDCKFGFQVQLSFVITQHCRDEELLKSFEYYLNSGKLHKTKRGEVIFHVRKLSDLTEIIIPFFNKYPIIGVKSEDYYDFCKVADMMNHKQHLTEEGLNLIRQIRAGMNNNRCSRNYNLLNSQNNNTTISLSKELMNIQSAENWKGFSETVRQLPEIEDSKFWNWFAGIIDGDGNFDIRVIPSTTKNQKNNQKKPNQLQKKMRVLRSSFESKAIGNERVLKQIRIKLHNRDIRILKRIQDYLHIGKIRADKNKPYSIYIISTKDTMMYILKNINGLIRIKIPGFKEACKLYNINYIEPSYKIGLYDPYFSGLVDTDGSIVFNYAGNRIECNLEFQYNEYTSKLNFDSTILNCKPFIIKRIKSSSRGGPKDYTSIAFKFQNVNSMLFIYDYFLQNRLYCDMKFYRVTKIKPFIEIRKYKSSPRNSVEHKIYSDFIIDWIKYENPLWYKVPFVRKYLTSASA
jgi:LAGLIDADG endonuclease